MDSVAVTVPLRPPTKKMKKRKELDALAPPHAVSRRSSGKRSSQELLSDSSDERSEYWNVSTTRGGIRKTRSREAGRGPCRGLVRACGVFLAGTIVLVTAVLIWLFIDVRQQLNALRAELDQVIAGSEGVPESLHMCHTLSRNFESNITHITSDIQKLNKSLNTFSGQIAKVQQELQQVQVSLKSAPELTSMPKTMKDLQNSIGQLEIDIHDLQTTYKMLTDTTSNLQDSQTKQMDSLAKIKDTITGLSNNTQQAVQVPTNETLMETKKLWETIAQLSKNLTHINETLTMNITWAQEDLANDHKKVVSLQDMALNASAQILTLQQECARRKDQEVLQKLIQGLSVRVDKLNSDKSVQDRQQQQQQQQQIKSIEQMYSTPDNITSVPSNGQAAALNDAKTEQKGPSEVRSSTEPSQGTSVPSVLQPRNPSTSAKQFSSNGK